MSTSELSLATTQMAGDYVNMAASICSLDFNQPGQCDFIGGDLACAAMEHASSRVSQICRISGVRASPDRLSSSQPRPTPLFARSALEVAGIRYSFWHGDKDAFLLPMSSGANDS